MVNLIEIET